MQHPDEGTIHAWLDDALSESERAEFERHVVSCAECSALVAEARGMIAGSSRIISALDAVPGGVIPRPAPAQSLSLWRLLRVTPARAAIAASLLVAASAVVAKRHDTPDKMVPRAPVVAVAPQQAAAPPAPAAQVTPAPLAVPKPTQPVREVAVAPTASPPAQSPTLSPVEPTALSPAQRVAQPAAQPAEIATARKAVASSAADVNAAASGAVQRNFSARKEMQTVAGFAGDAVANDFAGCYQVVPDSARPPWLIPDRFALQPATANRVGPQGTVRAVTPEGRVDSLLAGSSWSVITPTLASVSFASINGPQRMTLELAQARSVTAVIATGEERHRIAISRPKCVP